MRSSTLLFLFLFCLHFVFPAVFQKQQPPEQLDPKALFELIKKDVDFESAQALNFDFTLACKFYVDEEIPELYAKVARAIYRCVERFFLENEPVFVLTALLHLEYLGENMFGLPGYEEALLILGKTRKDIFDLVKDDIVFSQPLAIISSCTLSVPIRHLALSEPRFAEYFPTLPFIIDSLVDSQDFKFPFNENSYFAGFAIKDMMFTYFLGQLLFKTTTTPCASNIVCDWAGRFARHFSEFQILERNQLLSSVLAIRDVDLLELLGPLVTDSDFVAAYEFIFDPNG